MENSLIVRRSRRSTAGNRMEAALAELAMEDLSKDAEDDIDFAAGKDEDDVFESDFESTDEEVAQADVDAGEKAVHEEEQRQRKAARSRVEKATAAAHARQKVTFNPQARPKELTDSKPKAIRRVSLGVATNAETGEVMAGSKRQSRRKHTVLNTSLTVSRMRDAEERRAAVPKKTKVETRVLTQDELISRALDTEDGNIVEHRDYLKLEDEKRKRARVVRAAIEGPLLRWISKGEEIKVTSDPIPSLHNLQRGYTYGYPTPSSAGAPATLTPSYAAGSYPYYYQTPGLNMPSGGQATIPQSQPISYVFTPFSAPQASQSIERMKKVTKNYVVHESSQINSSLKPSWRDTMKIMFGDHVKWEDLRVFIGKGRPFGRPKQTCPLTGLPARYRDPRTGVAFANVHAYEVLTRILAHEYEWCDDLDCYVSRDERSRSHGSSSGPPNKRLKIDQCSLSASAVEGRETV